MTYVLMVSRNAGMSYHPELSAPTIEALAATARGLDEAGLRWVIETEDGRPVDDERAYCGIHKGILNFIQRVRAQGRQ